jgi:hypothetical protein
MPAWPGVMRWRGTGHARLLGPSRLARAFPTWFDTSVWADSLRRGERRRDEAIGA